MMFGISIIDSRDFQIVLYRSDINYRQIKRVKRNEKNSFRLYSGPTFSPSALRLSKKRCQKSLKRGRSIFFRLSLVLASTLT